MKRDPDFKENQKVDNFVLEKLLGAGQDGEVWRATQIRIGKHCAIKFLNSMRDPDKKLRFEREIQILAVLDHAHIVQIQDRGEAWNPSTGEIVPYYVMEFLQGEPIHRAVQHLPTDTRVDGIFSLLQQVFSAVEAAHIIGVSHGDIKPANILVLPKEQIAKLSDFGFGLMPGVAREPRSEYPESSYTSPPGLTPQEADVFRLGRTIQTIVSSTPDLPPSAVPLLADLGERLATDCKNTSLSDAIALLRRLQNNAQQAGRSLQSVRRSIPELAQSVDESVLIHDPVYGAILLTPRVATLIDQPELQRLRGIRESPAGELVYPSLTLSGFEQLLGEHAALVRQLRRLSERTDFREFAEPDKLTAIVLAGLLLSSGRLPFGLALRNATEDPLLSPEHVAVRIVQTKRIRQMIADDWQIDADLVVSILAPAASARDVPAMRLADSLLFGPLSPSSTQSITRISLRIGVPLGFDSERLLMATQVLPETGELAIDQRGLRFLEEFYRCRLDLDERLFRHVTVRAADLMLGHAFRTLREGGVDFETLLFLQDSDFLTRCLEEARALGVDTAVRLINHYRSRRLHKRILSLSREEMERLGPLPHERHWGVQVARAIGEELGVPDGDILVDTPVGIRPRDIKVVLPDGRVEPAGHLSELFRVLAMSQRSGVVVYGAADHTGFLEDHMQDLPRLVWEILSR